MHLSCEVKVTGFDELKQIGLNKSSELDGLPNGVYLRLLHMFVPILTNTLNNWFSQGGIPGHITKACMGGSRGRNGHNSASHRVKEFRPELSKPLSDCCLRSDRN